MYSFESKKGFTIGSVIAVVVGIIVIVAVAVPITQSIITSANLTGTNSTIASVITPLLLVATIVLVVSLYSGAN